MISFSVKHIIYSVIIRGIGVLVIDINNTIIVTLLISTTGSVHIHDFSALNAKFINHLLWTAQGAIQILRIIIIIIIIIIITNLHIL